MANLSLIFILIPAIIAVVLVLAMCVVVARTPSRSFHDRRSRRRARNPENESLNRPHHTGEQGSQQQQDISITMHTADDHDNDNDISLQRHDLSSFPPPTYQESRNDSLVSPATH